MAAPLRTFTSSIDGRDADVAIYVDRIEWDRTIPVAAISSVTTKRAGLVHAKVSVIAAGSTTDFRVSRDEASAVQGLVSALVRGSHPAQQPAPLIPPFPPVPAAPGASIPAQSAAADVPERRR